MTSIARELAMSTALRELPQRYYEEAARIARDALGERPSIEKHYAFGGICCRIRYGDERLEAALHRSMAHLEIRCERAPELDIGVWDESRSEHLLPRQHPHLLVRNHRVELCCDNRYLAFEDPWSGTKSYIDRRKGEAWHSVGAVEKLPLHERAAPLRPVLNALFVARRMHLVHAAAVGTAQKGVLLTGAAGAGKSTTAFSCLGGKLGYAADSWCGIHDGKAPEIFSVYSAAKLRRDALERFADARKITDGVDGTDDEKAIVFLAEHHRASLLGGATASALLVPVVTDGTSTEIEPIDRKEGWRALLASTLSLLPGWGRESTELLMRFCARVPAYRLKLGGDPMKVREALERFVEGL